MTRAAWRLLLLTLLGCHGPRRVGDELWQVVCTVPNNTSAWVQPVAQDALFHTKRFGTRIAPWGPKRCELWPWRMSRGRLGYINEFFPADTNWTKWFDL